jgi:predicted nucleotidyltransferase
MDLVDLLLEEKKENEKYFKEPEKYAKIIKKKAKEILKKVRVFLFGSIVRGDFLFSSDIDVLVVSDNFKENERGKIISQLLNEVGFFSPFQIHLVKTKGFKNWYKKFIKKEEIKEIK